MGRYYCQYIRNISDSGYYCTQIMVKERVIQNKINNIYLYKVLVRIFLRHFFYTLNQQSPMRLIAICIFIFLGASAYGQETPYSMSYEAKDSASINAMLKEVRQLISANNKDSAVYVTKIAYKKANEIGYKKGIGESARLLGTNEMRHGKYDQALNCYKESIANYVVLNDSEGLAETYTAAGINEGLQNNSVQALSWFLRAMKIHQATGNQAGMADLYYKIGLVYSEVNDFDKALEYQNKSLVYAQEHGDEKMMMNVQGNMGRKKEDPAALKALRESYRYSMAFHNGKNIANTSINLGNVFRETGKYDSSAFYLVQALAIFQQADYPVGVAGAYNAIGDLKMHISQYDSALYYSDKSFELATKIGDEDLVLQSFILKQGAYRGLHRYREAAELFDTIMVMKEKVDDAESRALLVRTKMNDEMQQKEVVITNLKADYRSSTQQRNIFIIIAAICACFFLYIFYSLHQIRKKNKQLGEQKKDLEDLNMVKDKLFSVVSHDLRTPFTRIIGVLELINADILDDKERQDITSQLLLSTSSTLETLDNLLVWGTSQLKKESLVQTNIEIGKAVNRVLALYDGMAIHKSIKFVKDFEDNSMARFDKNQLEFIIRNLVANAIKFSYENQDITLKVYRQDDRIMLVVSDEGVGMTSDVKEALFDPKIRKITKGTSGESGVGLGLMLVTDFLKKNNGSVTVESEPHKGSTFIISMPAAFGLPSEVED